MVKNKPLFAEQREEACESCPFKLHPKHHYTTICKHCSKEHGPIKSLNDAEKRVLKTINNRIKEIRKELGDRLQDENEIEDPIQLHIFKTGGLVVLMDLRKVLNGGKKGFENGG